MISVPLYGLVLAGGRSVRMGEDKGALIYHGSDQAHHISALLAPHVARCFVSVRNEQLGAAHLAGLVPVVDHYASPSPLNGIVSAMRAYPKASWLVAAVDMPFITAQALETLIAGRDKNAVATCFESPVKSGPDPLLAIWEGHGFAALDALLRDATQHICPFKTLLGMKTALLTGVVAPETLANINTSEERAALWERAS